MNTPYLDKLLAMSDEELAALEGVDGNRSSRRVAIRVCFIPTEPDKWGNHGPVGKPKDDFFSSRFDKKTMEHIAKLFFQGIPS